jgi:ketosteroid isomerase-like protein
MHAEFEQYVSAFNAQDVPALERHLDPAVVFDWHGEIPTLYGRDAMLGFYAEAWTYFDERIEASDIDVRGDVLRATIRTRLDVFRDWPDCPIQPFARGEQVEVSGRLQYVFNGGRINHIMELTSAGAPAESGRQ